MNTITDLETAVKELLSSKTITKSIAEELRLGFEYHDGIICCTSEFHMYMLELGFLKLLTGEPENYVRGMYHELSPKARKFYNSLKTSGYYTAQKKKQS